MLRWRALMLVLGAAVAGPALAIDLELPGAPEIVLSSPLAQASTPFADGPWQAGNLPTEAISGPAVRTVWHLSSAGVSAGEIAAAIAPQAKAQGYDVIFSCETRACGGFDFRFALDVAPEPEMHVDLGDFAYLYARRSGPEGAEGVAFLVSTAADSGFVQLIEAGGKVKPTPVIAAPIEVATPTVEVAPPAPPSQPAAAGSLGAAMETRGAFIIAGLEFQSGSVNLGAGEISALAELAAWLVSNPQVMVTLVGHTDSSGSQDANLAISRQRAESVRARLLSEYGVPANQVLADGVGALAPIASNQTEEGRQMNRRVEVVWTATR